MATQDPPAVEIVNPEGASRYLLTGEHASNFIPDRYDGLGLAAADLQRHIAWDIGAAGVARNLSKLLDAPLFLSGYSRLLIDCNRPVCSETSIPQISEATFIPGNQSLPAEELQFRADHYYWPFQNAVSTHLDDRVARGTPAIIIGIHSFTPVFKGVARPWHAGILFRRSKIFGLQLVARLSESGLNVAANEPYIIEDDSDYTVPVHGEARGLDAVLVEIRQDLIADDGGQTEWARRIWAALSEMP
jgi:predicted N-formylglutamate amidohydrolase